MNRANFPGRRNRKRIEVLAKLEAVSSPTDEQERIMWTLKRRIVPQEQALNTFTKKWRGAGEPPARSRAS